MTKREGDETRAYPIASGAVTVAGQDVYFGLTADREFTTDEERRGLVQWLRDLADAIEERMQ